MVATFQQLQQTRPVVKPTVNLSEAEEPEAASFDDLKARLSLLAGPPGSDPPVALVSGDYEKNVTRLLVLLPSPGSAPGSWDTSLAGGTGHAAPLIRWAKANGYAVALFSSEALEAAPVQAWDRVLKGSPARFVGVAAANGALATLQTALAGTHSLLYSRFRAVVSVAEAPNGSEASLPAELKQHLKHTQAILPASWAALEPRMAHQHLFELMGVYEDRWCKSEGRKYTGFRGLKENDMPGLKRMPVETRITRLDRDRDNDELARLLRKHEQQVDDEQDEPGVD